ncbi:MAG: hypothetical protein WAQ08_17010 [Aquabacterium sp.]|uniref:hypothetical protein n=1 Tax=Aquabacterium sp. TaxID=1872578 RepID=UPI003BB1737E
MVSFDQFLGVLRDRLLETQGAEMMIGPYMLTACLVMSDTDWQHFAQAVFDTLHFDIDLHALSGSSTILDLYFASVDRFQLTSILAMDNPCIKVEHANDQSSHPAYFH